MEKETPESRKQVRMQDVAAAAGVSLASVSRVLRTPGAASPDITARVQEAVKRLGYAPSPIASSMAGAQSPIVGVVVPTLANAFFSQSLQAMSSELEISGLQLMMGTHDYDPLREEQAIQAFLRWNPVALIVTGIHHSRDAMRLLLGANCPVYEMWDYTDRPLDNVIGFSMEGAGRAVAQHLIKKRRRNLVFVGHQLARDPRAKVRADAFMAVVAGHDGVTGRVMEVGERNAAAGIAIMQQILTEFRDVDGVAFSGDAVALGGLTAAQDKGRHVPGDISVIGFGDLDPTVASRPPLTTIRPPHEEMGRLIAQSILRRAKTPDSAPQKINLGFELIERGST
ncbi:LacI family DNA-binding transcriptional regulator [Marinovum sp. 2_MG-2023]|uniref:LacI family DNA-binding transcriptional regulator n=1 Tax=unclassified Marinovum TaxID=2647166 RepID=UPI0026E44AEB|nr:MULTISPECIES: LacI family DNA-binding transcriptional regulator [unclassified Marinovum]MDO6730530.1 LacI family DNA-binding transcriptional regulator [Marinovum sp. 2_MG-2023]MDO6778680.1 LacI family DNA-binding transcriptional regulator [Marinovum sp. 1_MG-2023]